MSEREDQLKKFSQTLSQLKDTTNAGQAIALLQLFEDANGDGILMSELVKFVGNDNLVSRRRLSSYIANCNIRYLNEKDVPILGEVVFKIKGT